MSVSVKRVLLIGAGLVGALVALGVGVVLVVSNTDWGRAQVRTRALSALNGAAHGVVRIGGVTGNLLQGLTLHDLLITDSTGAPFVSAEEVHANYGLRSLLSKKIALNDVRLVKPVIVLDRPPDGVWNYERIFPSDTAAQVDNGPGFGSWITLTDVVLVGGQLLVRTPWQPDTSLALRARDSVAASAVRGESRTIVVRAPGRPDKYQQVQEFRDIDARLPLVRLADPERPTRLIRVDSMRMKAFAFAPPGAEVRQMSGTFELDTDSLWFAQVAIELPRSRAQLRGQYVFDSGDLLLHTTGAPVALADVQFLYPALPDEGEAVFDLDLALVGETPRVIVKQLELRTGTARMQGDLGVTIGDTLFIHDTKLEFSKVPTALLEKMLPGLNVPREGLLSGRAIVDGSLNAMRLDGDVTFDDSKAGRSRVLAAGHLGASNGVFRAQGLRVTVAPLQVALAQDAMPSLPIGGTVNGSAILDGRTDQRMTARAVDLTHRDRGERSRLTGSGAVRLADAARGTDTRLEARLTARPLSLVTIGRFAPAASLRGAVSGPIELVGPLSDLAVNSSLHTSDGGRLTARGRIDLASRELGYALDVTTKLFNANELVAKAPVTSVSASLSARGRGVDAGTMRGAFAANVSTSTFDTVAVDSSRIRVRIADGIATLDTLAVRAPGAAADATGTFGLSRTTQGKIDYRVQVDSLAKLARYFPRDTGTVPMRPLLTAERLARARSDSTLTAMKLAVARAAGAEAPALPVVIDTAPDIPRDSLAGSINTRGVIAGGLKAFDLRGTLDAYNILAQGSVVPRARATYSWSDALTDSATARVDLSADSVTAAGFALDSVSVTGSYRSPGGTILATVYQNSARDYLVGADYAVYPDRKEVRFNDLRLRFDSTRWASTHAGAVRWGQPGIEVDSIDLRNATNGRIFVHGRVPTEGDADLRAIVQNFQIGDLLGLLQSDVDARGLIGVDGRITGSGRAPLIAATVSVTEARYGATAVPNVASRFDYVQQRLRIDGTLTDSALGGARPLASVQAVVPVNLALFDATGDRLLDAPATAVLRADSLPLDIASRFTDVLANTRGFAHGNAELTGTVRKPKLAGALALRNISGEVVPLGITVQRMNGALRLQGDTVLIDSLVAYSGGRFALSGGIGIDSIMAPSFNLRVTADNVRVLDNDHGRARADAAMTITGPYSSLYVEGRARVREGVFYIPEPDTRQVLNAGDPAVFAVIDTTDINERALLPGRSALLDNLRMDVVVAVDRDTWVRSKEANIEIYSDGDLRVIVDRRHQSLALEGVVNTDRGEYEFLSKRFQVKRGAVQFIGTQDLNPLLQITGEYEVKQPGQQALSVRILIGGTLLSPRLTLESDAQPPISQSDLLSYLAFGNESGSLLQFGGSSLSGSSPGGNLVGTSAALATRQLTGVALGVMLDELEGQAARSLGADVLKITPASNLPTELAGGNFGSLSTLAKGTQLEFGKYLNTHTFVGLQLQSTLGFRIERRFSSNPGLSLQSTFQPRFFLPEPSLSVQEITKSNAFGLFLVKRWRF